MAEKNTLQFGRKRPAPPPVTPKHPTADNTASLTLLCGVLTAAVFFIGTLSDASLSGDAARIEATLAAVPAMSDGVEELPENSAATVRERLRERVRSASGEPFGYMEGRWNLWEYLGDVMASLLAGG